MGKFRTESSSCRTSMFAFAVFDRSLHLYRLSAIVLGKATTNKASKAVAAAKGSKHPKPGFKLNAAQEVILQTLGKLRAVKKDEPTREMVMQMSKNSKTKAGYDKNCGILRKQGFLAYPSSKTMELTDTGVAHVGSPDPSDMTNEVFHASIKQMISKKAGLIFDAIVDGKVHDRKKTAEDLGYDMTKLSGYDKDLSKMSSLGFLDYDKTTLQLTKMCFPMDTE